MGMIRSALGRIRRAAPSEPIAAAGPVERLSLHLSGAGHHVEFVTGRDRTFLRAWVGDVGFDALPGMPGEPLPRALLLRAGFVIERDIADLEEAARSWNVEQWFGRAVVTGPSSISLEQLMPFGRDPSEAELVEALEVWWSALMAFTAWIGYGLAARH